MKKTLITLLLLGTALTANAGFFDFFDFFKSEPTEISVGGGMGTIEQLDQWRATSTPVTGITTNVFGKTIYTPFSDAFFENLTIGDTATTTTLCFDDNTCMTSASVSSVDDEDVLMGTINSATYDNLEDYWNVTQSAGKINSGGELSDNGDGTITISAGTGIIKTTNSSIGVNLNFDWVEEASLGISENENNYVYIDYNSGTPIFATTTIRSDINGHDKIAIGIAYNDGSVVHLLSGGVQIQDLAFRTHQRAEEMDGFKRASGMVIAETGTRGIAMTEGVYYRGNTRFPATASSTITFSTWYNDGAWQETTGQTTVSNTQYNNYGTGLATITPNQYGLFWVYRHFDGHFYVIYGIDSYNLAGALAEGTPANLPTLVSSFSVPLAKIIVERDGTNFQSVYTLFETVGSSPVTDHGALGGLADDDHLQYLRTDGSRALTGAWDMGSQEISNLTAIGTSTMANLHVTGDAQVDGNFFAPVTLVSSGNATINGDLTVTGTITGDLPLTHTQTYVGNADGVATATSTLTVLDNGYVGIGTDSPSSKLDVFGPTDGSSLAIEFDATGHQDNNSTIKLLSGNATGRSEIFLGDVDDNDIGKIWYDNTNNSFLFFTNNDERMRIDSSGNIGIGTTDPVDKLDVAGKIAIDGVSRVYYPDQTDFVGTMYLGNGDGGANLSHTTGSEGQANTFIGIGSGNANTTGYQNTANGYLSLYSNTTGTSNIANGYGSLYSNTTGYRNTANGYLSLFSNTTGTSNTANGYTSLYELTEGIQNTAIGYNTGRGITTGDYNTIIGANVIGLDADLSNNIIIADGQGNRRINVDGAGNVGIGTTTPQGLFAVATSTDSSFLMVDSDTGYVGIGTDSPSEALDVVGNINTSGFYQLDGNSVLLGGASSDIQLKAIGGNDIVFTDSANNEMMRIVDTGTSGNVGIGTTSPAQKLSVDGKIYSTEGFQFPDGTLQITAGAGSGWTFASTTLDYWFDNTAGITGNSNIVTVGTIGTGTWEGTAIDFSDYTNATASTGITFTDDAISTNDSEIVHDDLSGFEANEHFLQSAITETGTIATGVWQGTDVGVAYGGTGKSSWTQFLIPYADTTTSFSQIAIGTDGQVLTSGGAGVAPSFEDATGGGDVSKVDTPVDNQIGVWTGDGTIEGTSGLTYTGSALGVTGSIASTGDMTASTNSSTTADPRVFGYKDLSAGEAARFEFGDEHNALQNAYAGDINLFSYWGLVLTGGRQNYNSSFVTMPFSKTLDTGVLVKSDTAGIGHDGGSSGNPITTLGIMATSTQWANLTEWMDSAGDTMSLVDYAGNFVIGDTATSTYKLKVDGTTNITGATTLGGNLGLGANDITMSGSLGVTGTRLTKGWFTDLEVTNAIAGDITGSSATVTGFTPASGSLTLAGADALTITTTGETNSTLPLGTKTLVATDVATLSSLTSIGTIGTGTWEGTDVGVAYGGTGVSTFTQYGVLVGNAATDITALSVGTNGQLLVGSTGADPVFATLNTDRSLTATLGAGTIEIDADLELFTEEKGVYIESPVVESLDELFGIVMNDITITYVYCDTDTGTVTMNLEDGSANNILSSELVCDAGGQTSCASGCDVDTINASYDNITAKTEPISYDASAVASDPTKVSITIGYTKDD